MNVKDLSDMNNLNKREMDIFNKLSSKISSCVQEELRCSFKELKGLKLFAIISGALIQNLASNTGSFFMAQDLSKDDMFIYLKELQKHLNKQSLSVYDKNGQIKDKFSFIKKMDFDTFEKFTDSLKNCLEILHSEEK